LLRSTGSVLEFWAEAGFSRTANIDAAMNSLLTDIRYALRGLLSRPAFSIVAILTLALGIGANTAIFSVVNGVVLQPLRYPEPARLMFISSQFEGMFDQFWVSAPEFIEFRERNKAFESVGAYTIGAANLGTEIPSRPITATVSHDLMTALGVQPLRGRLFTREDTIPNTEEVAIISSEVWRNSFGQNPSTVGALVDVGGVRTRIVGIMPPGYDVHDEKVELWRPLRINPASPGNRGGHFLYLVGRLKPGVTLEQARADLETQLATWESVAPQKGHAPNTTTHRYRIDPLKEDMVGEVTQAVWVLQGAVAFVLFIACANLANLLLARAESRQKEFAVRTAMGASRRRMLQQFVTEGIVISLLGGALGVWLAAAGVGALVAANPDSIPRAAEISVDVTVLAFTLGLALVTGVIVGIAPLLHLSQRSMNISLREGGSRTTAGSAKARMRGALVIAEVALAVVLVVGAGLLLRSFWNLLQVDAGFNRDRLTTFQIALPSNQYPDPARRVSFYRELIDKIQALPGVQAAAAMSGLPPSRDVNANDTEFIGVPTPPAGPPHNVDYYQQVTIGYLSAMGIPVLQGRAFTETDAVGSPVVLVNETLAKRFYPNQSPLGRVVKPSIDPEPAMTIVGVVKDVKQKGVGEETGTEIYFLYDQLPAAFKNAPGAMNVVVRSSTPFETVAPALQQIARSMDARLPIVNLRPMDEVFAESMARPRFVMMLLVGFAALALFLAAIGTYGVLSYLVSERRQEIGIRMALGAERTTLLGMVMKQGLLLALVGLCAGLVGAVAVTRLMQTLLFNVRPADPATMAAVTAVIAGVALIACYVPARRATRVDPLIALRTE
jgi:putative ABC transport system permease protein